MKKIAVLFLCLVMVFSVASCGYNDSAILERLDKLEQENEDLKNRLLLLEGSAGGLEKVYSLNETATYYSSTGLKLFDVTPTEILKNPAFNYISVKYTFKAYNFVPPTEFEYFLNGQLIDDKTQLACDKGKIVTDNSISFNSDPTLIGRKTLYFCISSVNMNIPFAKYSLDYNR